jgi:hypothetical protein
MELFTINTTLDDIRKQIDWNIKLLDLVVPIDKEGERLNKIFPSNISLVQQFENEISISLPSKQKEIFYSNLSYYKNEVGKVSRIQLAISGEYDDQEYNWFMEELPGNKLKLKTYNLFCDGYNPPISAMQIEIEEVLAIGLTEMIQMVASKITDELGFNESSIAEVANYLFTYWIKKDIEYIVTTISFLRYLESRITEFEISDHSQNAGSSKLVWRGTPAQFGFIIIELIGNGYLEKPTGSYKKDAAIYLNIFEIDTTKGTLEKEINCNSNSLSTENARHLNLPHKDKLK